ncbi:hypothetical protein LPJ61_003246 [Coemansia biformis]|uniref:gamma-glutamylcyclotransferase n=1 Tax=Coemansia biformis TaxID=1286918 RepID=A0A9W8CYE8_9FUNG|nr:hypothetical protein LPJ61_003246 [Coemansia biformis]
MNSDVLTGRRGVRPVASRPVTVPDYQLTFDMAGLPYWEPGFGIIQPVSGGTTADAGSTRPDKRAADCQVGAPLHCVAFSITRHELEHIVNTEGGSGNPDFGYQLDEIACTAYDGTRMLGYTLIDTRRVASGMHPSPRYHSILIKGAAEHGLAQEYIERLAEIRAYVPKTRGQQTAKYLVAVLFAPLMVPPIVAAVCALALGTKTPRVVAAYNEWVVRLVRLAHNHVFAPVFGAGC